MFSILPQNIEAEEAIIGGILWGDSYGDSAFDRVKNIINAESFSINSHKLLYRIFCELKERKIPIDLMTVASLLVDRNQLETVGGQAKLVQLSERIVSTVNIDKYALLVREKAYRRQVINFGYKLTELANNADIEKLNDIVQDELPKIVSPRYTSQKEELLERVAQIEEIESPTDQWFAWDKLAKETGYNKKSLIQLAIAAKSDQEIESYTAKEFAEKELVAETYLVEGLLRNGTLAMIAAEGKTGKSLWHYNLSYHIATGTDWGDFMIRQPTKTLIIQTDETRVELQERIIMRGISQLDNVEIVPKFYHSQLARLKNKIKDEGFKFVVLDSLTSINQSCGYSPNDAEYGYFVYQLSELASELGICILLVHHTTKCPVAEGLDKVAGSAVITRAPSDIFLLSRSKRDGEDTTRLLTHLASRTAGRSNWRLEILPEDGSYEYVGSCNSEGILLSGEEETGIGNAVKLQRFLEENEGVAYEASELAHILALPDAATRRTCGKLVFSKRISRRKSAVNPRAWAYYAPKKELSTQLSSSDHPTPSDHLVITSRNAHPESNSAPSDQVITQTQKKNSAEKIEQKKISENSDHLITSSQNADPASDTPSDHQVITPPQVITCNIPLQSENIVSDYANLLQNAVEESLDRETVLALVQGVDPTLKPQIWARLTEQEKAYIKSVCEEEATNLGKVFNGNAKPASQDEVKALKKGDWIKAKGEQFCYQFKEIRGEDVVGLWEGKEFLVPISELMIANPVESLLPSPALSKPDKNRIRPKEVTNWRPGMKLVFANGSSGGEVSSLSGKKRIKLVIKAGNVFTTFTPEQLDGMGYYVQA